MKPISLLPLASLCLGLTLTMTSLTCNDTPTTNTRVAPTSAFVGQHWQMSEFQLTPNVDFDSDGQTDTDLLQFMPECDRDNTLTFEPTGAITIAEGEVLCNDRLSRSSKPEAWSYDEATGTITIQHQGHTASHSSWGVLEATNKLLKVKTTVTQNGKTLDATLTWKAIE